MPKTVIAAILVITGSGCELVALDAARRDLNDASRAADERQKKLPSTMAASKHIVSEWIDQATRTRAWGIYLFAVGLLTQMAANLIAL